MTHKRWEVKRKIRDGLGGGGPAQALLKRIKVRPLAYRHTHVHKHIHTNIGKHTHIQTHTNTRNHRVWGLGFRVQGSGFMV